MIHEVATMWRTVKDQDILIFRDCVQKVIRHLHVAILQLLDLTQRLFYPLFFSPDQNPHAVFCILPPNPFRVYTTQTRINEIRNLPCSHKSNLPTKSNNSNNKTIATTIMKFQFALFALLASATQAESKYCTAIKYHGPKNSEHV